MKLLGYAPDIDRTTPGVVIDCDHFIPSKRGYIAAPSAVDAGIDALDSECRGAAAVRLLNDTFRIIAGTPTNLYEKSGTSWADVTRASGGDYALGAENRWRFGQFGNTTLAVAKTETLQASDSSDFADVSGAPKADIVETVGNFVFLFNTDEASFGDSPNRWWCSAVQDYTDWTPSKATQCVTGILVSTPGRIFAGRRFGEQIIAYKRQGMYRGTYVGGDLIWDFQLISDVAGCMSQEAVVNIGTDANPVHMFMGPDNFWIFDGATPTSLKAPVVDTVFADFYEAYAYKIQTIHDKRKKRVYFLYPSLGGNGAIDSCVVYNYQNNTWGRDDRTIEAALEYLSGGITYDTWDTVAPSYDTLPANISYDSPYYAQGQLTPAIFGTDHTMYTLDGVGGNSSFTLGDLGDDENFYHLDRVKPKWLVKPTSAEMTNYYKNELGDALTTDSTTAMVKSRFDKLRSARWHSFRFDCVGDYELNDIDINYQEDGSE